MVSGFNFPIAVVRQCSDRCFLTNLCAKFARASKQEMTATSIDAGSAQRSSLRAGAFELSDVVFPSARRLSWHEHPRACVAIVVAGAVRKRFAGSEDELREGGVVAMPPEEPHEDVFGTDGARLVVVERTRPGTRVAPAHVGEPWFKPGPPGRAG